MSTTKKAAVHMGQNYNDNLEVYRNTSFEELEMHSILHRSWLHHQVEILNVKTIEWTSPSWTRTTLFHQVIKWTKVRVYSDSVLCLGIFMSMFSDIEWTRRRNSEKCISNSDQVKNCAKRFSQGHWRFLGPGGRKKWNASFSTC